MSLYIYIHFIIKESIFYSNTLIQYKYKLVMLLLALKSYFHQKFSSFHMLDSCSLVL